MRALVFPRSLLRQHYFTKVCRSHPLRTFHASVRLQIVKPLLLADIGEGIRECEIIQWFVEPNARVEEFDKICEVQSDKASVEITTRFTGVVKKLYYESGQMAIVGKPLLEIDVEGEVNDEALGSPSAQVNEDAQKPSGGAAEKTSKLNQDMRTADQEARATVKGTHAALATPAVRYLTKELGVDVSDVQGTGRDGRVLKDDIYKFVEARKSATATQPENRSTYQFSSPPASGNGIQKETTVQLTNIQSQMFKTMTQSLRIPHFLYADEVDFSNLVSLRHRLNKAAAKSPSPEETTKLSFLPFIIKALSLALHRYPILNARIEVDSASSKPTIVLRSQHNIGIAMDTPQGLLVPVIKNVSSLTVSSIASELLHLQLLATAGKLSSADLAGGTITVTNIGSIGGTYVSPVIVEKEVAILGIGKVRTLPVFSPDGMTVVPRQICNFSWSADHRIVDGATMARAAELLKGFVEEPDSMMVSLR